VTQQLNQLMSKQFCTGSSRRKDFS